MLLDSATLRYS